MGGRQGEEEEEEEARMNEEIYDAIPICLFEYQTSLDIPLPSVKKKSLQEEEREVEFVVENGEEEVEF